MIDLLDKEIDSIELAEEVTALLFAPTVESIPSKYVQDFLVMMLSTSISHTDKLIVLQQLVHECHNNEANSLKLGSADSLEL